MIFDAEGCVINGPSTYEAIARHLYDIENNVLIAWTDGGSTQLDIVFTYGHFEVYGPVQGGIRDNYLFVSIMRLGAFAFRTDQISHPAYYAEKLHVSGSETTKELAELINGVKIQLRELNGEKNIEFLTP